ncbi:MAG: iron-sulfur cluster assembly scaffold protein [Proteobacteria bacterium]|nr:iron-sulfur cluster assembly scaffold protein [Pseudomonadota bacterium]
MDDDCGKGCVMHREFNENPEEKVFANAAELIKDHAENPRNFGDMCEGLADVFVSAKDPACGDTVELWIIVEEGKIFAMRFQSNGCKSTVAELSMMTTLVIDKTIEEAKKLTEEDILAPFEGLLGKEQGCPLSSIKILQAALEEYEKNH